MNQSTIVAQAEIAPGVFQGRHGLYSCSRETFRLLKALHKLYWQEVRQLHAWMRWRRKAPHNRVLLRRGTSHDVDGSVRRLRAEAVGMMPEPRLGEVFTKASDPVATNPTYPGLYGSPGFAICKSSLHNGFLEAKDHTCYAETTAIYDGKVQKWNQASGRWQDGEDCSVLGEPAMVMLDMDQRVAWEYHRIRFPAQSPADLPQRELSDQQIRELAAKAGLL